MTSPTSTVTAPSGRIPVIVGLSELEALFPQLKPQTIRAWRLPERGNLPVPEAIVSRSPLWLLEDILAWADKRGTQYSHAYASRLRSEQGARA